MTNCMQMNCIDMCPYADENLDCHGECAQKLNSDFAQLDKEHCSPATVVVDVPVLNGGW